MEAEMNRVGRVVKILTALQTGRSVTADNLAKTLGISRRTIFRDLQDLKKAGVNINFNGKNHHYTLESDSLWPIENLNEQEILSLLLLVHKSKEHIHLPFSELAILAAEKIEKNLPNEIKRCCANALEDITIKVYQPEKSETIDKIFLQIRQAVLKKRNIKISYFLHDEENVFEAELSPYHLVNVHNVWYVVGKNSQGQMRTINLGRIKLLTVLNTFFSKDDSFDVQDYLSRPWAAVPEGQLYEVKLEFQAEIAKNVTDVKWHKSQKVTNKTRWNSDNRIQR